ncbi:hypothetical protein PIB30_094937 [Stylosanthes scabra]|uniref:Uncharacterized protein n=1 Tax=Stylosanthes scabra TaxID=79078 RepID=A0ABU6YW81_9FABA|nr:hypothetical protein [Stylosanthes scabra]
MDFSTTSPTEDISVSCATMETGGEADETYIDLQVIDLVVENLADENDQLRWLLPIEFSERWGIWVAKWMQLSYMWEGYLDKVDEKTRMSLALKLVMGKHNRKVDQVQELAMSTCDKIVRRAMSTEKMNLA